MPIFMDRHEMSDMTAEKVAEAHRSDVKIQARYGVRYLTYWFDQRRGTAFCLVDAPDAATAERAHREAHGEMPSAIIPVDLATVEAFLGRIEDAGRAARVIKEPGLRVVMFTDIVGSTEMTLRLGDAGALELVRVHDALVRRSLTAHRGREVKHTGDGIMAVFAEASDAARAAIDIQRGFCAYNSDAAETLSVRIGLDAGEPVEHHCDLFGATVQRASRLCDAAEPAQIMASDFVRGLCGDTLFRFVSLGEGWQKGFATPLPMHYLEWRELAPPAATLSRRAGTRRPHPG